METWRMNIRAVLVKSSCRIVQSYGASNGRCTDLGLAWGWGYGHLSLILKGEKNFE